MTGKTKNIAIILLLLLISIIVERSIPHYHVEQNGVVIPDFGNRNDADNNEDHEGEQLHATYYFAETNYLFSGNYFLPIEFIYFSDKQVEERKIDVSNYNILPKIINFILFVSNICLPNAPPF